MPSPTPSALPRPTVVKDLLRFRIPATPRLSPDRKNVAFVLRSVDIAANRTVGRIAVTPVDTDAPFHIWTSGPGSESDPQWSPDGKWLGFVSTRHDKTAQVFRMPVDGGEAVAITELGEGSLGEWSWSPDSRRIALLFRPLDSEHTKESVENRRKQNQSTPPRLIDSLRWRMEGTGFLPRTPTQLLVIDADTGECVAHPVGGGRDVSGLAWHPDGARLLFVCSIADDPDHSQSDDGFFWIDWQSGCVEPVATVRGPKGNPAISPDGLRIAWLGHDDPAETWGVRNSHLWLLDLHDFTSRDITAGWNVHVGDCTLSELHGKGDSGPDWYPDSQSLGVIVSDHGKTRLWRIHLDGTRDRLVDDVSGFSLVDVDLAWIAVDSIHAGDIVVNGRIRSAVNEQLLGEIRLQRPVAFAPPAPDGANVPCFALFPPGSNDSGPHPTVVYIHGGPHLMYGENHLFHEFQALAAAGYLVLFPNPRGSKGYGEAWTAAIRGDWGKPAMDDVMACVDHAVAQGWADPERLAVAGGSYGGYLTAWIIGQTDRFRAAVPERGVYDLVSMAGTCDFPWKDHDYFQSNTHADSAEYRRNSPLTHAGNVATPTLVIHSEGDLRCPIGQAEQYFRALAWIGNAPVRFLRYGPEANHDLSRGGPPDLRVHRQQQIHAWLDQYVKVGRKGQPS